MYKLKAFTLMELLIGMIISSIVISFCYMSYSMIYKQYMNYKAVKVELVEALELNSVLNSDISKAEKIVFDNNKLILIKEENKSFEYNFLEKYILRKTGEVVDTFNLIPLNIVSKQIASVSSSSALIEFFSFDANVLGDKEHFQFFKSYDAKTIMDNEIKEFQVN